MIPYLDLLKGSWWIGLIVAGVALISRWLHLEKKTVKQEVLIEQNEQNRVGQTQYYQSLEKLNEKSDQIIEHQNRVLKNLDPNDPRWNDILFKDASKVLDSVHDDELTQESPRKKP